MMDYAELVSSIKSAGYPVDHIIERHFAVPTAANTTSCSVLTIDGLAEVMVELLDDATKDLLDPIAELETNISELQAKQGETGGWASGQLGRIIPKIHS